MAQLRTTFFLAKFCLIRYFKEIENRSIKIYIAPLQDSEAHLLRSAPDPGQTEKKNLEKVVE